MSSLTMIRLLASSSRTSCLRCKFSTLGTSANGVHGLRNALAHRSFASNTSQTEEIYKSMGLNEAKYPEQEMTEILRRVSKIEGPEIERRRLFNFVRNAVVILTPIVSFYAILIGLVYFFIHQSDEIPDDLDD